MAKVLFIGSHSDVYPFERYFQKRSVDFTRVDNLNSANKYMEKNMPDAVIFILPNYWEDVTTFLKTIRGMKGGGDVQLIYIGDVIEGSEHTILQEQGVDTLTLGPVPHDELARYIAKSINI